MLQCLDFPIEKEYDNSFVGWDKLKKQIRELGIDGLDGVWLPTQRDESIPKDILIGGRIVTMPDWVDYIQDNRKELRRRIGTAKQVKEVYGEPKQFILHYIFSLHDAIQCGAKFISMEVYNVTYEESQSYEWRHDDQTVMNAAATIINLILRDVEPTFDFLIENSWWPGFRFTEPEKTEYLLSRIEYPRKGIMLNTSHLMNTNPDIRSEEEGAEYICSMLEKHGDLAKNVLGLRLSQTVSGEFVRRLKKTHEATKEIAGFPKYQEAEGILYYNINAIDQRLPWTSPEAARIVKAVDPKYLVHSPRIDPVNPKLSVVKEQMDVIQKGLAQL